MHLLCNKELHVPVLADHNEAVWPAQTRTCSILLHKTTVVLTVFIEY